MENRWSVRKNLTKLSLILFTVAFVLSMASMLTYAAGRPHGAAVGAFQSRYLKYADKDRQAAILRTLGFNSSEELGEYIARLAPVSAPHELLERSAESVMKNAAKLKLCPYELNDKIMEDIIKI